MVERDDLLVGIAVAERELPPAIAFRFRLPVSMKASPSQRAVGSASSPYVIGLQEPAVGEGHGPLGDQHVDGFDRWIPHGPAL
jgi:hypothetical protein